MANNTLIQDQLVYGTDQDRYAARNHVTVATLGPHQQLQGMGGGP